MQSLIDFLKTSYTAYHTVENAKKLLSANGFTPLSEKDSWHVEKGGKYYVDRGGSSLIAFRVEDENAPFKIVASHGDSPALKLKENAVVEKNGVQMLNTEPYGGGIWYTAFDRPLKIAGRVFVKTENGFEEKTTVSNFNVTIPSLAIHQHREVNDGFKVDPQVDLLPLLSLQGGETYLSTLAGGEVLSHDLFLVNAENPYEFGLNGEFLAAPRIDNLTSVFASLNALVANTANGNCVAAIFDNEEVGSTTYQGANSDFLKNTLKRISLSLGKNEEEFFKALACSFLVSADNAHAKHPNHPETSDPINETLLGGGVVIKHHAKKSYVTDGKSAAVFKTVLDRAGIKRQAFFNRSGAKSGGTLGTCSLAQFGVLAVDIGIAQLAMHSFVECIAKADYTAFENGLKAFYATDLSALL
ncbi:MAG: M18 family aminopeptidase [Clostridia bacterium]|nr:M18 family aminopeptidase [Clostridia bacterium]